MAVFNGQNTRVIALLSCLGALLYYQSAGVSPRHPPVDVQVHSDGRLVTMKLSPSDVQNYLRVQEASTRNESGAASSTPSLPRQVAGLTTHLAVDNSKETLKGDMWEVPVLEPSGGAFLKRLNFSGYDEEDREFLESRRKLMIRRADTASEVCRRLRKRLAETSWLHLVWDTTHTPNVIWCPLYKVASTTWMVNFMRLAHFNDDNPQILKLPPRVREKKKFLPKYGAKQGKVYELYPPPEDPQERIHVLENGLRTLVVRHPYSRIVSAYRDKMLKMEPRPIVHRFRELQLKIIAKYRKKNSSEKSPFPTFPEFIQFILDSTKHLHTREDWINNVRCWTPYWAHCNVCSLDYNLILKLETMQEDERFLITLTNMTELKELKSREWRHLQNGTSSDDLVAKYFKQLSAYQIKQLHKRYITDFELFGYHQDKELLENAHQ